MNNIQLNIGATPLNIFIALLLIVAFTIFVYRYTLPPVSKVLKYFLILLRTVALIIIFLLLFEPAISVTKKIEERPEIAVFIDNSQSVAKYSDEINNFVTNLSNRINNNYADISFYTFGDSAKQLNPDSLSAMNFNSPATNFNYIFDTLKAKEELNAAIIVTDGNFTSGINPVNLANTSPLPLIIAGVGDTLSPMDIRISDVITNEKIFSGKATTILARINYQGTSDTKVKVSLKDENKVVDTKIIQLNGNGFSEVEFSYTPVKIGEQRLNVKVDNLPKEKVTSNNSKIFYLNVQKGKINFLIVTSSPTPDFSFVYNTFNQNKEIEVHKLVELKNKQINPNELRNKIDSADVIGLINYPSPFTSKTLRTGISNAIKSKPFLIIPNPDMAAVFLNKIKTQTGFSIIQINRNIVEVQPVINDSESPLIKMNGSVNEGLWNEAPPVSGFPADVRLFTGAKILLSYKINGSVTNYPMAIAYSLNQARSLSILAYDLWRWKLQSTDTELNILDNFFTNSVKWLNAANNKKKITVKPVKKVFANGEKAEFIAEVFNEKLEPVNDAIVEVNVSNKNHSEKILLNNFGNGLFKGGKFLPSGNSYSYSAKVQYGNISKNIRGGEFTIENYNVELNDTKRNINSLRLIATASKGRYYNIENSKQLTDELIEGIKNNKRTKVLKNTYQLWQFESMLIFLVILFSIEWFLRKRAGLL